MEKHTINEQLKTVEEALVLVNFELKQQETLVKEKDAELKMKGKESKESNLKEFSHPYTKEYFLQELHEKSTLIEKQKNDVICLESSFKDKVSDYHHLSKAYAELSKQLTQMQKLIQMQKC